MRTDYVSMTLIWIPIDTARYCLCCSLDEVVLNTNWGGIHSGVTIHYLAPSMLAVKVGKRSLSILISAWRNQMRT